MEKAQTTLDEIINSQVAWAHQRGIPLAKTNVCQSVEGNLFSVLHSDTSAEFAEGAGNELGTANDPGSMSSLRSSSALAVNVFDPWRGMELSGLARLLGAEPRSDRVRFEVQYPTGLRGIPPHLDVVLDHSGGEPLAIESKFTELYSPAHNDFRSSYFEKPGLWDGFDHVRKLATGIADESVQFGHLGAAQLIKHALGLKHAHGPTGFRLLYLWYEWPSETADIHSVEVRRFAEMVQSDFRFVSMTYQEFFQQLTALDEPRRGYRSYLSERYFAHP